MKDEVQKWIRLIKLTLQGDPIDSIRYDSDLWRMHITVFQYVYNNAELMNGSDRET